MLARVKSCAVVGLEGALVTVEVDISTQMTAFLVVGLPDTAVQEARERVRAAIRNSGFVFTTRKVTVNLAPADLRKAGPAYDLPIAVGVLLASQQVDAFTDDAVFLGELSLDGSVHHTNGVLPMVALARQNGIRRVFVPADDAREAALVEGVEIYPVPDLRRLVEHLSGGSAIEPYDAREQPEPAPHEFVELTDFSDIVGQENAKRALEVAAAGNHNLLMRGPPGSGKTLLARSMPLILPPLSPDQCLEVTKIYSVAGLLPPGTGLVRERPFRAPHHTISHAGLIGGGRNPRPGEVTLSHRGVLFLDELPEFGSAVLEVLRQPLEDRVVTISRAAGSVSYPANFTLVSAMNPCPCGYAGDYARECTCSQGLVNRYQRRISGPLMDRIDIFVDVPRVEYEKLSGAALAEASQDVRRRVVAAREVQLERFRSASTAANAEMSPAQVRTWAQEALDEPARQLLRVAMERLALSARAFHRVLKLARTIADLDGSDPITSAHLAEAIQYRERLAG
jgi:magnesium chelatase family protein